MIPAWVPGREVDSLDEPAVCDTAVLTKQKTGLPFFGFCKRSFSDDWKTGYLFFEKLGQWKTLRGNNECNLHEKAFFKILYQFLFVKRHVYFALVYFIVGSLIRERILLLYFL